MTILEITKIPQLNSVVIKQKEGHFFISVPNSIIIDKDGWLKLTHEFVKMGFIEKKDLDDILEKEGWYSTST